MKKILLLLTALLTLSACQESVESYAERQARERTMKDCPIRMNDEGTLILERFTFDKNTLVWCQDFLLDSASVAYNELDFRDLLLKELKNMPSYKPYRDHHFVFQYVFCNMKNPKDTLINIKLLPKDYE